MKIEIISGSPRVNSVTRRVALHLKKWLDNNTEHETGIIDMKDWNLPPVQTVFVSVDRTPDEFKPLLKEFLKQMLLFLQHLNIMEVIRRR